MPIYEYRCKKCDSIQEELHGADKKPKVTCEKCGESCEKAVSRAHTHGTSTGVSQEHRIYRGLAGAKEERMNAAQLSHMGGDPYRTMDVPNPDIVDHL